MMGWDGGESEGVLGGDAKMVHMQDMNFLFSHVSWMTIVKDVCVILCLVPK